jgi:hypothetical protein
VNNYATAIDRYEDAGRPLRLYRFSERDDQAATEHTVVSLSETAARVHLRETLVGRDVDCVVIDATKATPLDLQRHVNSLSGDLDQELEHIERHESLTRGRGR